MISQMMVHNHLVAHYRKLERVKRKLIPVLHCGEKLHPFISAIILPN